MSTIHLTSLLDTGLLTAMLGVGAYSSYTDISRSIIPNAATGLLLCVAVIGQAAYWAMGAASADSLASAVIVAVAVGGYFYDSHIWAAGDVKLYVAMALAMPPSLFTDHTPVSIDSPAWALALNTLAIQFAAIVLAFVVRLARKTPCAVPLPFAWPSSQLGIRLAGTVGLVCGAWSSLSNVPITWAEALLIVLVLHSLSDRTMGGWYRYGAVPVGILLGLYLAAVSGTAVLLLTLWGAAWAMCFAGAIMPAVLARSMVCMVPVDALKPGMIPAGSTAKPFACGGDVSGPSRDAVLVSAAPTASRSLTVADIAGLQRAIRANTASSDNVLAVEQGFPLAPFLVAGSVVAAALGGTPVGAIVRMLAARGH